MDVALYVGLTVACVVIGGLAIFLARLLRRKGRDHSLYSMARNGKHLFEVNKFALLCALKRLRNARHHRRRAVQRENSSTIILRSG